jgi:hypothetical protein
MLALLYNITFFSRFWWRFRAAFPLKLFCIMCVLQLAPWLAAEVPHLVDAGLITAS